MMRKCSGLIGRIFGHKFLPVISRNASSFGSSGVKCKAHVALSMAEKYRDEVFHGLACQRCGALQEVE